MSEIDVSKYELVDCWFYIDRTPPKGQGDWCGAIHKGACKLNSTDCKDTPIERCLIKSLYEQLQQLKIENEEFKKGVMLKCPQCGEIYLNRVGCELYEENQKYKQYLDEIEKICKCSKGTSCDECPLCSECEEDCRSDDNLPRILLQLIKQTKEGEI